MNAIAIIILLIIVVALVYVYYSFNPDYLVNADDIRKIQTFTFDKIDVPASNRYCYEGWFNIKTNFPPNEANVLFNRANNFVLYMKQSKLALAINGRATSVDASGRAVIDATKGEEILITDAFPFQKWAYIVINVDGQNVDIYLDGRMVSHKVVTIGFDSADSLTVGNGYMDGRVAHFNRYGYNMNPQDVWSKYMYGSGQNESASNYHVKVGILKNNVQTNSFKLF